MELLTIKDVAAEMHVNINYVHKLRKAGLLQVLKIGNYKVRRQTLDQFYSKWEGWDLTNPEEPKKLEETKC